MKIHNIIQLVNDAMTTNVPYKKEMLAWLEKQGEQKPADKAEPKFKVGDWVIDKQDIVYQIANVIENVTCHTYGYDIVGGGYFNDNTEDVRLWTVQDAKDGNVLFTSSTASHETFIFKNIDEKGNTKCYFAYDSEDGFREGKYHFIGSATNCKPATKEQRDLLFSKMKEAGYEWDAEKKELKKDTKIMVKNFNISIDESLVDKQITTFCNIAKEMCELYAKKNHDYGNSFDEGCDKIGTGYPLGRLLDKMNRLIACMGKEDEMQVNESIEDTLKDLACYSVMTLSYLKRKNNK